MQRIISSVIGIPLLILVIYFGGRPAFFFLAAVSAGICSIELKGMFEHAGKPFTPLLPLAFILFLLASFYLGRYDLLAFILFALFPVLFFSAFPRNFSLAYAVEAAANTLFCILYLSLCMGYLVLIRALDDHGFFVFFVLAVTWSGDTFAFYIGKSFGKHLLAPGISPKKTIEGAIGGLAGSLIAGLLMRLFFIPALPLIHCLAVSLLCGAFGQLGDLVESIIKRGLGVKDSGSSIPGHGGFLDRIDGVLFSGPVFYFYYKIALS
ncbi:MAG: phosphatidate cytidylyltransferase [Nitrospinae bacterium]|nr:phosphatidate cytidylyltransferase [Nitrospinota bacterium]